MKHLIRKLIESEIYRNFKKGLLGRVIKILETPRVGLH